MSSTLEELAAERRAVRQAIESLHLTPVLFELGARPHPPRALYRAYLEQSDVFVGLYWQRYGWVAPGEAVSGLEDEYRLAGDRPKLIYLKHPAPGRDERLAALLSAIRADDQVSYRRFREVDELQQLVADDLAVMLSERFGGRRTSGDGPPLVPPAERPLPHPLTRLVGREADVQRAVETLADPANRLVTLVGPGGIGKTRVALAVAEQLRDAYRDGVFFVPLAALEEPRLVLPTIADATGVAEGGSMRLDAVLRHALASAHCLIVLDNFEHLTDATTDIVELLAATSRVQVLATTRSILNVSGEHVVDIGPLELPTRRGQESAAVELFIDRITALRPGLDLTGDDRLAIEELSRRLDGLPLAIELAAARLRAITPRALLERLAQGQLDVLTNGPRDLPIRQRDLRDTIAWSYDLLEPGERALFERLFVFAGSADLESIEAVTDPARELDTLGALGRLVDASLVRPVSAAGSVRFGMLGTIREYAGEQLGRHGDTEQYLERHAEHYVGLAATGATGLTGADQLAWLERFDQENDNFRGVLRRAIDRGDARGAARMGAAMSWYWQMRSRYAEGRDWMRAVRELPGTGAHDRAVAWTVEAGLALWQGDFEFLETGADAAIAALNDEADRRTLGLALLMKAVGAAVARPHASAADTFGEASAVLGAQRDPFVDAIGMVGRAFAARVCGDADEAARLAADALRVSQSLGEWYVRSAAAAELATHALRRGALPDARAHALGTLVAARKLRNLGAAAFALELWAAAELADGRTDRAGRLFALAVHASGVASVRPWRSEAREHDSVVNGLRDALGRRLDDLIKDAAGLDLDVAVTELAVTQPGA